MGVQATVVFTDLHGSTAVFEALGNARATETVTHITGWIAKQCEGHNGRVVKTLGDGVLALFPDGESAVKAVVDLQRLHMKNMLRGPTESAMPIRIGVASGEVEIVDGDCYGDAVNVSARLCDLCGPSQIWANAASLLAVDEAQGVTFRILGPINIRGRAEPCTVYQIEWREEEASDFLTMQGDLDPTFANGEVDALGREVELTAMGISKRFKAFDLPINIGRVRDVEFMVNDPGYPANTPVLNGAMAVSFLRMSVATAVGFALLVLTDQMFCCGARNACCMAKASWPWADLLPTPRRPR
jgi:class 3 adenylate cyclase